MREAPSMKVIPLLTAAGAKVSVYDPQASDHAKKILGDSVTKYADNPYEAVEGASALIILVEWDEFKSLNLPRIKKNMAANAVFIDTRNLYDPRSIKEAGFKYVGIGR